MYEEKGKVLLGSTWYTKGEVYLILYPCNHHDFTAVLKDIHYTTLFPGDEVQFVEKVSKREGVFARVKNKYTDILYDIDYTNLGDLGHEQRQEEEEEIERKRREKRNGPTT